jgi:hypothetical protein
MHNKIFILLMVFLLAACTPGATPIPTPSEAELAVEEQAVYAALLQQMYGAPMYVLMDTTSASVTGVDEVASTLEVVSQNSTGLSQETADSFQSRNTAEVPLSADLDLGAEYVLMSIDVKSQIFAENQSGWEVFYARYPDAPGITSLSRVGFNNTLDQALVYVGTQSNWLVGAGYFLLLTKVNGVWTIDQQVMTWIS